MSLSFAVGPLKDQADLQRGRKPVLACDVRTPVRIKLVELLLQLKQVVCDEVRRGPVRSRCRAEQP